MTLLHCLVVPVHPSKPPSFRQLSLRVYLALYRLKTVTGTKQGAIRLPDDAPDSTAWVRRSSARLDVPSAPPRRFSISEDPESDTTSSDMGTGDARNSYESERHFLPLPLPPARREFAGRVPKPKPKQHPKNQGK